MNNQIVPPPNKGYRKIIIMVAIITIFGVSLFLLISKSKNKTSLTKEEKNLQAYSEQVSKQSSEAKFDLTGQLINLSNDSREITVKVDSGSGDISKKQGQEIKLKAASFTAIFNSDGNAIQFSELKKDAKISIKGIISDNNYSAEYIALL